MRQFFTHQHHQNLLGSCDDITRVLRNIPLDTKPAQMKSENANL